MKKKHSDHNSNSISPANKNEENVRKKSTFHMNKFQKGSKKNMIETISPSIYKTNHFKPISNFKLDPLKNARKYSLFNILPFPAMKKAQSSLKLIK